MKLYFAIFYLFIFFFVPLFCFSNDDNCTKIKNFEQIKTCIFPSNYDKLINPPLVNGSLPIEVIVTIDQLKKDSELIVSVIF